MRFMTLTLERIYMSGFLSISFKYNWAAIRFNGSEGLGSVNSEHIDNNNFINVNAGLQFVFNTSLYYIDFYLNTSIIRSMLRRFHLSFYIPYQFISEVSFHTVVILTWCRIPEATKRKLPLFIHKRMYKFRIMGHLVTALTWVLYYSVCTFIFIDIISIIFYCCLGIFYYHSFRLIIS